MIEVRSVHMTRLARKLEEIMNREHSLISTFSEWERKLNENVQNRSWDQLQKVMKDAEQVSEAIDLCEQERMETFARLREEAGEGADSGFYQVIVHLPAEERERISRSFRELKLSVLNLRGIVWGIDAYVRAVQGTLKDIIGEMSPMRRGTIYARNGGPCQPDTGPLVLNRHL